MITPEQIRAARALLNWKQSDLAKAAHISLPSINNMERAIGSPRIETMRAVQQALELAGIEFLGQQGVKKQSEFFSMVEYQGDNFIEKQNDDLFACMRGPQDVAMMCGLDERKFPQYAPDQTLRYLAHELKTNFTQKILICDNDDFLLTEPMSYRTLPPALLGQIPYLVYHDRLVMIMWEARRTIIIRSQSIADTFKKQFEFLWAMAKPPSAKAYNRLADPAYRAKLPPYKG
jgi:transcriptional regulator with XRE-family HTH domain